MNCTSGSSHRFYQSATERRKKTVLPVPSNSPLSLGVFLSAMNIQHAFNDIQQGKSPLTVATGPRSLVPLVVKEAFVAQSRALLALVATKPASHTFVKTWSGISTCFFGSCISWMKTDMQASWCKAAFAKPLTHILSDSLWSQTQNWPDIYFCLDSEVSQISNLSGSSWLSSWSCFGVVQACLLSAQMLRLDTQHSQNSAQFLPALMDGLLGSRMSPSTSKLCLAFLRWRPKFDRVCLTAQGSACSVSVGIDGRGSHRGAACVQETFCQWWLQASCPHHWSTSRMRKV